MRQSNIPAWCISADSWYYSHIERRSGYIVTVLRAGADQQVNDDHPGTPILRLEPRFGRTRVLDADGRDRGVIRSGGIVRGLRFVMRRNGTVVWVSTVRSAVRKRHRLQIADADDWMFETPFFWWQHLTGIVNGREAVVGSIGPTTRHWGFVVESGRDTLDLLAALAFMHWKWWWW